MKTALIFFLIGAFAGAFALRYYQRSQTPAATRPAPARPAASPDTGSALARKLQAWRLTPADIKEDLARTGQVVRSQAAEVGGRMADARIVAVIKAKYVLDSTLSALDIDVDCHDGRVVLKGTVQTPNLIGRAIVLALDTKGVKNVVSRLKVSAQP